ncbi:MAG: hypothetical protein CFE45_25630 [Burkholderiales bacterium PBB5]|nr:MAG: hypothetical protein CFE45_25630 [Burkholderiales bacterium PBB5]
MSFSRRHVDAGGAFAGVISASVPLGYLEQKLKGIDAGKLGAVALRDRESRLLVRNPPSENPAANAIGNTLISPALQAELQRASDRGTVRSQVTADQRERITSYQRLSVVPLLVLVAQASDDYLADWRREARVVILASTGFLLLYAAGLLALLRAQTRTRQARRRVDLLASAFERVGESLVVTDGQYQIIEVNAAFERLTGYRAAEWARAGVLHNACAYSTEGIEVWFARGLRLGERQLDHGELIDVQVLTEAELDARAGRGEVTDAKTLIGLLWLQKWRSGAWRLQWVAET